MAMTTKTVRLAHSRDETVPRKTGTLVQRLPCSGKVRKTNQHQLPLSARKGGFRL